MYSPQDLVDTLVREEEANYVRVVAYWLTHASDLDAEPGLTGRELIDVLAAAAAAHKAQLLQQKIPKWTNNRRLRSLWHPGDDAFFAYSLAHAPQSFSLRGILIEEDSLESV